MIKPYRHTRSLLVAPGSAKHFLLAFAVLFAALLWHSPETAAKSERRGYFAYIGTYTHFTSKGIYGYRFFPASGDVESLGLVAEAAHPSFLLVHPSRRFLYAVNEHEGAAEPGNTVTAFALNPKTGKLTFLNRMSSKGIGPCHIAIDKTGTFLAVANFRSGSIAILPIGHDGSLGEASDFIQHRGSGIDPLYQTGPHVHCVVFSKDNRFLLAADLGLVLFSTYPGQTRAVLTPPPPPVAQYVVLP